MAKPDKVVGVYNTMEEAKHRVTTISLADNRIGMARPSYYIRQIKGSYIIYERSYR